MINRTSYIIFLFGLIGVSVFFYLRSEIDFNADGPVQQSAAQTELQIADIAEQLGFSMDSLAVVSVFRQHTNYINMVRDSLGRSVSPSELNKKNAHTQSWVSVIGRRGSLGYMQASPAELFNSIGNLRLNTANFGKVIRLEGHRDRSNPTFVQGDSIEAVARKVVGEIFGYPLEDYATTFEQPVGSVTELGETELITPSVPAQNDNQLSEIEFSWRKINPESAGPDILMLGLETVVREFETPNGFSTKFGYTVSSFTAKNDLEPDKLTYYGSGGATWFEYALFASALLLALLIFGFGIRNIFKGKVEWRRALFIFGAITLAFYGWRNIFYLGSFGDFMSGTGFFSVTLNSVLYALIIGLYGAMAYISWEAFARSHKDGQVELVDAIWQRKFFVRETGSALVHGLFLGGLLMGIFALGVYLMDTYYIQTDSQFGYSEASIKPKILTINMAAWSHTWLIGFAQVGFVYGLAKEWIKNQWVSFIMSVVLVTMLITLLGRLIGTPEELAVDLVIFSGLGLVMVLVYQRYGIVTANTAWWTFVCTLMVIPYMGSDSIEMVSATWTQAFLILGILILGITMYRFGVPVSEVGDYIPEYQERIAQHLRVEKEIEIARESQYKLMPLKPPVADGIDVYGFFLPSFEVGGDYFDYVLSVNPDETPKALTMTVVDVSGKAMRAAMPAIFTSGLLLSRMKEETPEKILSDVSEPIFTRTDKRTFITCAIARFDFESKMLSIANAGHCKPVLKRHGAADFIQTPDPKYPLGLKPDTQYQSHEFKTRNGDVLLMYSDGLPEAINENGERFGFEEVPRLLERIDTDNLSAQEIAQEIKRTVQKFSNYQLADDTTVICLKV